MKRYISYFAVLLAVLLGAACSKDDSAAGSDNRTGVMAMTVSTRQTADTGEYDPLQHQTVYIYNDEGGLLRKYTSKEACPERLELLAGTYRVAVEAGEEAPADFTKRLYKGEETFTVKPGETTNVAVVCQIVNTVVEVKFDDSILQNLAPGYSVWIAGGEKVDEQAAEAGSVPALRFTAEGTGYYTLPAGMTSLAWLFRGTHVEGKNVEMEDYIPNVKAGGKYTLTFKYSPDLPGYIDCVLISVDPGTDDKDDEIIFSPDPAVISEGFDIAEIQKYVSGEKKYRILAFSELTRFTVSVGDKSYDALNGTTEGISLEPVDKYNVRLTLSDAFFASCQAGDQKVTLRIEDANGGSSEVATTYRLEGLVPVTADDYDLWANTVTLRVVSFTPGTTVQFGLRSSGGEWPADGRDVAGRRFHHGDLCAPVGSANRKRANRIYAGRRHGNHRDTQLRLQSHYQRHGNYRNIYGRRGTANPQRRHVGLEHDRRLRFSQRRGRIVLEQRQQYHDKNALHLYRREIREVCTGCKTNQHQYAGIGRRQPVHRRIRL